VVRRTARRLTPDEIKKYHAQALRENPQLALVVPPSSSDNATEVPRVVTVRQYWTPHALVVEKAHGKSYYTYYHLTPEGIIDEIMRGPAGQYIEAITPTIETFAVIQFRFNGAVIAKPVRLIGIDPE